MKNLFFFCFLSSSTLAQPTQPLVWHFPITRPHTGMLLDNDTQGLMVWGGGLQLNITIGRAGFWDHRGGNEFATKTTFADVKRMLQAGDEAGIKRAFAGPKTGDIGFGHPQQLGGGRLEITLPEGWALDKGELRLDSGLIYVTVRDPKKKLQRLLIRQSVTEELSWITFPRALTKLDTTWGWEIRAAIRLRRAAAFLPEAVGKKFYTIPQEERVSSDCSPNHPS